MSIKQQSLKGVVWSFIERFSVQGVQFILGIIMARLLTPSDFGLVGMLAIFLAIAQSLIDSGFSNALIQKFDRNETDYSTVFYFNIVVGIVLYGVLYMLAPFIAEFYNAPALNQLARVIGLNLFINSLAVVQRAKLTIIVDFKTQAKASLIGVLIGGGGGIILAYQGFGVWALVIQSVLSTSMNTILLWVFSKWIPRFEFSMQSFNRLFSFGSKLLVSGIIDTIYRNIYTIVIGKQFSAQSLGFYTRADQFAQFPSSNITGILGRVTYPILSSIQNDDERLRAIYLKYLGLSAYVVFPLMIGLAALAQPLIDLLLTPEWSETALLLSILCFSMMWYPIHAINLNLLQVKGRSDLFLRLEIIKKIIGVLILSVTIPLGVVAMCIGQVFSSIIALIINTYYTGKLLDLGFFRQMKDILPILILSLTMGFVIHWSIFYITVSLWQLIVGSIIGLSYYLILSFFLKQKEYSIICSIVCNR